jgi:hypothetical protein
MGAEVIPKDGRIRVEVTVRNTTSKAEHKKTLLADTGANDTQIEMQNANDLGGKHGPIVHGSFGDMFEVTGLEMEVEVEDAKGTKIKKTCPKIAGTAFTAKFRKGLKDIGCVGVLGMDQFDSLGADPVKNAEGARAWLELRVEDPAPAKPKDDQKK